MPELYAYWKDMGSGGSPVVQIWPTRHCTSDIVTQIVYL
jgi:hypothetical protein